MAGNLLGRVRQATIVTIAATAVYAVVALWRIWSAEPQALLVYAFAPAKSFGEHQIPPLPHAEYLVRLRLRSASLETRARIIEHPLASVHVVFGLASDFGVNDRNLFVAQMLSEALLEIGVPLVKQNAMGCTSLQIAARSRDIHLKSFLLNHGADMVAPGSSDATDPQCRLSAAEIERRAGSSESN